MGLTKSKLKKATFKNTPEWTLKDRVFSVKVVKVYDGDTIWIALPLNGRICRMKVRLMGVDTPELKPPKSKKNREKEIKKAKAARDFLSEMIMDKIITIECGGWDKYGRLLGTLFIKKRKYCTNYKININQLLIDKKHGVPYFGGTKST